MLFTVCLVVSRDDIRPVLDDNGEPRLFSQAEAVDMAKQFSQWGERWQPRPVKTDDNWRAREQARFDDGTYQRVPWDTGGSYSWLREHIPADHFVHVSKEKPGFVAFTASPEHGAADRQTRMRPGRYLEQYMRGALSSDVIRVLASNFAALYEPIELKFATTPDEIEQVYLRGPNSCMSHSAGNYDSSQHPVRMYGAGDLAIAYIGNLEDRVTARCVAWPEKKVYSRVYGDEGRLVPLLEAAGYSGDNRRCLTGARLLRIEEDGGFIAPYLDWQSNARDDGTHLIIDPHGKLCCDSTNGRVNNRQPYTCERCDADCDQTYTVYTDRYSCEAWCEHCRDDNAFYCEDVAEYVDESETVSMYGGDFHWSQWGFEGNGATCEATDESIRLEDSIELDDGTIWSRTHFRDYGIVINGRNYDRDNAPEPEEDDEVLERVDAPHMPRPSTPSERMAAIAAGQLDLIEFIAARRESRRGEVLF